MLDNVKETRGGMRWNSSTLYQGKKTRKYSCTWCGKKFSSKSGGQSTRLEREGAGIGIANRYCCPDHRQKMFHLKSSLKNKRRVTKKNRKRHTFRPEVWRA